MNRQILFSIAALACAAYPARARSWGSWDFTLDGSRDAERCSDLKPRASGEIAQATESFAVSKSEAAPLQVNARDHASIRVRGWNRSDYSVEACKFAVADTRSAADQALRSVSVTRSGARFTAAGPSGREAHWQVVFFVHAPKDASLDLETGNAPVAAKEVSGKLTVRASNGPLAFDRCSGTIDAETTNGPISMTGGSGDVRLLASNGPISLSLADPAWTGPRLEARTNNGPISVSLPNGFRSGVRVETSGHAPISCAADGCQSARTEGARFFPRSLEFNGSNAVVRLSTQNGPVSLHNGSGKHVRII